MTEIRLPTLFPCAARVTVPQLGSEDVALRKSIDKRTGATTIGYPAKIDKSAANVDKQYLKKICTDITFSDDVVKDRAFHLVHYDQKYLKDAFKVGDIVSKTKKAKTPRRQPRPRETIPYQPSTSPQLKSVKKKYGKAAAAVQFQRLAKAKESTTNVSGDDEADDGADINMFLTDGRIDSPGQGRPVVKDAQEWDAYLMSLLSSNTANWIVNTRMGPTDIQQSKLQDMLVDWHGEPSKHHDLIRDDVSEPDYDAMKTKSETEPQKVWTNKETTLLEKVYGTSCAPPTAADPYSDENEVPFYRQPTGLRKKRKSLDKESAGAINATAHNIDVKTYQPPPPPTIRDFINPEVGDKFYDTGNMYQQEKLTGAMQIHERFGDQNQISLSSDNRYKKDLQEEFPRTPEHWSQDTDGNPSNGATNERCSKVQKGMHRWKALPEPVDDSAEIIKVIDTQVSAKRSSPDVKVKRVPKHNNALLSIADEWRAQWHLSGQYADSSPDDLIRDMADIQEHVRLKAIATVGKAASYRPPEDPGIQLDSEKNYDPLKMLPDRIFVALQCLLDDKQDRVRKAAAITLYSLQHPSDKAAAILRQSLQEDNSFNRWTAAQCLTHYGECDSIVITEVLNQLLNTEDAVQHEQAIHLLGKISVNTSLVHSMMAEHLNSSSWRHKVIVCKVYPTLHGNINKDITQKLSNLMWNDWHSDVRKAAAQTLGKTGHGKAVHDDLRERILTGNERMRVEAISKVGNLGIMTAKLLPAFLQSFDDEYVSVRTEVCITCGCLKIQDEKIIGKLVHLASYDHIWKIKALAIQALGNIGVTTQTVQECLLWALRYEENSGIRAEACHSLTKLGFKEDYVIEILQDRLLVESEAMVRDEIQEALEVMGFSPSEDLNTVTQIKDEVRKLGKKENIAEQIAQNEQTEGEVVNRKKFIFNIDDIMVKEDTGHGMLRKNITSSLRSSDESPAPPSPTDDIPTLDFESASECGGSCATLDGARDMYTPSTDQELERIMGNDDSKDSTSQKTSSSSSSLGTSSRTGSSHRTPSLESRNHSRTVESDMEIKFSKPKKDGDYDDDEVITTEALGRMNLETRQLDEMKESLNAPAPIALDGRLSRLTCTASPSRRGMISREAKMEQAQLQYNAGRGFAGFSDRYADLVDHLDDVDNAYMTDDHSDNVVQKSDGGLVVPCINVVTSNTVTHY